LNLSKFHGTFTGRDRQQGLLALAMNNVTISRAYFPTGDFTIFFKTIWGNDHIVVLNGFGLTLKGSSNVSNLLEKIKII
jgi:hypothetical protein